jgi:hypothetical protein
MLIRSPDSNDAWMGMALVLCASFLLVAVGFAAALIP